MKIYIAGPITGNPYYEEAFRAAHNALLDAGHQPINPALLGAGQRPWHWYMRQSLLLLIDQAEAVALLTGWEQSKGARLEHAVALALELPIQTMQDWVGATAPQSAAVESDDDIAALVTASTGELQRCEVCHGDGCAACNYRGVWKVPT